MPSLLIIWVAMTMTPLEQGRMFFTQSECLQYKEPGQTCVEVEMRIKWPQGTQQRKGT